MGLWKLANCQYYSDTHADYNIHCGRKVHQLHQLLEGMFHNDPWELIVTFLNDIEGQEKSLDLIDE